MPMVRAACDVYPSQTVHHTPSKGEKRSRPLPCLLEIPDGFSIGRADSGAG